MAKRVGNAVIDTTKQAMVCEACGAVHAIALGDLKFAAAVAMAFGRAHNLCKPGDRPCTWQSVPTVPVTTNENRDSRPDPTTEASA